MVLKRKISNIDTQVLRLNLYQLLCYFTASERIAKNKTFINLIDEFQDEQITILLITIASIVRTIDNRNNRYLIRYLDKTKCGFLIKNEKTISLDLRDACNKILHADTFKVDIFNIDNTRQIKPYINLYGKGQDGIEWRAKIDIFDFVDVINGYVVSFF